MGRRTSFYLFWTLLSAAVLSCLAGLAIGLWSLLADAAVAELLGRAAIVLVLVALVALVLGWWLTRLLRKPAKALNKAVSSLRQENFALDLRIDKPADWSDLAKSLVELGAFLEERDRRHQDQSQAEARTQRREALDRFGQGVSREIQKSLSGVLGFVEIAMRQPGVEGQLKNYLTLINQEAQSARQALERILRYVRQEDFPTELLDVNTLLLETSRSFMEPLEQEKITVQLNLAQDLPRISGDPSLLRHVFSTLIENAREAMAPTGGTLELSTNVKQEGKLVIMVKDSGRGIATEDRPRLFTPFFTTKGNQKGAGLNLAIAERIIGRHQGHLDVWSKEGEGTVFFVHLQAFHAEGTQPPPPESQEPL